MSPEPVFAAKKAEQLQKELIQAQQRLNDFKALDRQLANLSDSFAELEQLCSDPVNAKSLQRQLQEKQIFNWFSQLQAGLLELQRTINNHSDQLIHESEILETNRIYRNYLFETVEQTNAFVLEASQILEIQSFQFKPAYIGMTDFSPLQQQQILDKNTNDSYKIIPANIAALVQFIREKKIGITFRLETDPIKIWIQNGRHVRIETDNVTIHRLDTLAKSQNAAIQND